MPLLTRWSIRAAMLHLLAGMVLGMLYHTNTVWHYWDTLRAFNPVYVHLIVIGWLTQLIFAVAYWMFPIISKQNMRGNPFLAWAAFILLNVGLLARALFEPWRALSPDELNALGLALGAVLQAIGAVLLVVVLWPRVRERAGH